MNKLIIFYNHFLFKLKYNYFVNDINTLILQKQSELSYLYILIKLRLLLHLGIKFIYYGSLLL